MAKQNFVSNLLCSLGGDRYTEASTRQALENAYRAAKEQVTDFDIGRDKIVLVSDLHKGAKNRADDFRICEPIYCAALAYYYEMGYSLCVMGDAEELWEEIPNRVLKMNDASFSSEKLFHENGRYLRLWGNHDEIWQPEDGMDSKRTQSMLQPLYGTNPLNIRESILLRIKDGKRALGEIVLLHGHQGTQNEGDKTWFARLALRYFWRPIQQVTGFSCNTPATDWELRADRDRIIYKWVSEKPGLVLIAGHTHAPVFTSRSHKVRLVEDIDKARKVFRAMPLRSNKERTLQQEKIAGLVTELEWLEHKMGTEELKAWNEIKAAWERGKKVDPKPCYFNTGCCCFADGDITGIEIANGEIRLVRWPDDNNDPKRKILQADKVKDVFEKLEK